MNHNFDKDLQQELNLNISRFGIKIPTKNLDEMLLDFLTIYKKSIHQKPRFVLINPDLEKKLNNHPKKKEVAVIKEYLIRGCDVNIFQSQKLFQTRFHDHLAYEWDIHHFHLSTKKGKNSRFVKSTNQLLFVYIDNDKAILLDIENHDSGIFGNPKWIEILHYHFPEVISPYKTKGITDFSPKPNPLETQTLWDKGYSLGIVKIDNTIYYSKGIGRMVSGHSSIVALQTNNILRWLHEVKMNFENHFSEICDYLKIDKNNYNFKLQLKSTFEIIETNTNQLIIAFPESFIFNK